MARRQARLKKAGCDVAASGDLGEISARYAEALFALAGEQDALQQVADDLTRLRGLFAESADLRRLADSPVIGRADQARGLASVLDRAGIGGLTARLVALLAANRRLPAIPPIIERYLARLAVHRGETTADVTTARPLTAARRKALEAALKKATGSKAVTLRDTVDPSILGGMVVRIGSRMVDASVGSRLEKLVLAMKGA